MRDALKCHAIAKHGKKFLSAASDAVVRIDGLNHNFLEAVVTERHPCVGQTWTQKGDGSDEKSAVMDVVLTRHLHVDWVDWS